MNNQVKQKVQEEQYSYPYHYIPIYENGRFSQMQYWSWGYRYIGGMHLMLDLLRDIQFNSLLDVGCGDGRFLREVAKIYPNKQLLGVDYSERAIAFAKAMSPGISYMVKNIIEEPLQQTYDVATSVEVLEHIPSKNLNEFLQGVANSLKAGGYLLLTVPHRNISVSNKHYQHFTSKSLDQLLKPYFKIESYIFFDRISKVFTILKIILLLENRWLILNNQKLLSLFFRVYKRRFFYTNEQHCLRVAAVCKKRETL